jgi:chemotaxis protein MotB
MSAQGNARPIIKRKKIVKGDGHHGGAWKVAYADFVTAMMAFFMLMWLLGATTENQRKGIADYFNPTIPINRISGGGDGAFGGDSVFSEETLARSGTGAGLSQPTPERAARGQSGTDAEDAEADAALAAVEEALLGLTGESIVKDLLRRHIVTRLSDEGLVIELFDTETAALFLPDDTPRLELRMLVPPIVAALALVENPIAVEAHVASRPGRHRNPPPGAGRSSAAHRSARCSRTGASRNADRPADRLRRPPSRHVRPRCRPEQPHRDRRAQGDAVTAAGSENLNRLAGH